MSQLLARRAPSWEVYPVNGAPTAERSISADAVAPPPRLNYGPFDGHQRIDTDREAE